MEPWFPRASGGTQVIADWNEVQNWFNDEAGVSNLDVNCRGDAGLANYLLATRVIDGCTNRSGRRGHL